MSTTIKNRVQSKKIVRKTTKKVQLKSKVKLYSLSKMVKVLDPSFLEEDEKL
jgi:hypothetical protein